MRLALGGQRWKHEIEKQGREQKGGFCGVCWMYPTQLLDFT